MQVLSWESKVLGSLVSMLLASTALHKKGGLWDPLVKGCVEQWPDLADPIGCETSP